MPISEARSAYPLRQANIEAVRPKVTEYDAGVIFEDRRYGR